MIKTIRNISQSAFKRINFYTPPNKCNNLQTYISIYDTDQVVPPRINHPLWHSGVQLQFDDIDKDFHSLGLKKMSDDQADQITAFVDRIHSMNESFDLIIHCYAGVSRSAGVGLWVNDIFRLHLPNYPSRMLHNTFVYSMLNKSWERKMIASQGS